MKKAPVITLLCLLSLLRLNARSGDYDFLENIGLGATAVPAYCFLQDPQGLIWIGSDYGLFSYDGYTTQSHSFPDVTGNISIYCMEMADSSRFYVGTNTGLLVYNFRTDSYEDTGIDFHIDTRALLTRRGVLWIGSSLGFYTYRPDTGELSEVKAALPHQLVFSLALAPDGDIYIGTYNGCCRYRPETGECETIPLPLPKIKNNLFINSLLYDGTRGCVWIGTEGALYRYTTKTGEVSLFEALQGCTMKSLSLDREGRLLIGTDNGLYIWREGQPLLHRAHDSRDTHSFSGDVIWRIFTDREENVWFGTDTGVSLARNSILRHVPVSSIDGTGQGNTFSVITRDSQGELWLGGSNGLIHIYTPESANDRGISWYKPGDSRYPLAHEKVRDVYEDSQGTLWVATDGGLCSYDRPSRQFTTYNIVDSSGNYDANWPYSVFVDDSLRVWIGACLGGVFVVDKESLMRSGGRPYVADKAYTNIDGLSRVFVMSIVPDQAGNVWGLIYASRNYLFKITAATDSAVVLNNFLVDNNQNLQRLLRASDGSIWVGMDDMVMRIDPEDENHTTIPLNSFEKCEVLAMTEALGQIWVSTTEGLWSISCTTLKPQRHDISDRRFTAMYYNGDNDMMYLGGTDGFTVTSLSSLLWTEPARPLILSALYVNNTLYRPDRSIRWTNHVELPQSQNNLTLCLTDLNFSAEEKSRIMYKFKRDREWNILPSGTNRIIFNNLRHGRYRLLACIPDADGNPSGDVLSFAIRIRPIWYSSNLAIIIYLLMFVNLVWWTLRFVQIRRKYLLERAEKKRIVEQSEAAKLDYDRKLAEAKARILALAPTDTHKEASYDEKFFAKVVSLIDEHISDPNLNVSALCEWTDTNSKQMYRKIKQITGQTPVDYIKSVRIKVAAELLRKENFTVAEVVYMVGFSSHSYFSKCFSAQFGMTPKQFMASQKQDSASVSE